MTNTLSDIARANYLDALAERDRAAIRAAKRDLADKRERDKARPARPADGERCYLNRKPVNGRVRVKCCGDPKACKLADDMHQLGAFAVTRKRG